MYNRYGKQKVLNSLAKQGRILSIMNQKGKNNNSFIYSGRFINVSESKYCSYQSGNVSEFLQQYV